MNDEGTHLLHCTNTYLHQDTFNRLPVSLRVSLWNSSLNDDDDGDAPLASTSINDEHCFAIRRPNSSDNSDISSEEVKYDLEILPSASQVSSTDDDTNDEASSEVPCKFPSTPKSTADVLYIDTIAMEMQKEQLFALLSRSLEPVTELNGKNSGECMKTRVYIEEPSSSEGSIPTGGDIQHKCDTCSKVFSSSSNLNQHLCIHTKEKPFTCGVCFKTSLIDDDGDDIPMVTSTGTLNDDQCGAI